MGWSLSGRPEKGTSACGSRALPPVHSYTVKHAHTPLCLHERTRGLMRCGPLQPLPALQARRGRRATHRCPSATTSALSAARMAQRHTVHSHGIIQRGLRACVHHGIAY